MITGLRWSTRKAIALPSSRRWAPAPLSQVIDAHGAAEVPALANGAGQVGECIGNALVFDSFGDDLDS